LRVTYRNLTGLVRNTVQYVSALKIQCRVVKNTLLQTAFSAILPTHIPSLLFRTKLLSLHSWYACVWHSLRHHWKPELTFSAVFAPPKKTKSNVFWSGKRLRMWQKKLFFTYIFFYPFSTVKNEKSLE